MGSKDFSLTLSSVILTPLLPDSSLLNTTDPSKLVVYRSAVQLANFLSLRSNRLWSEDLLEKNPNPYPYIFTLPSHPRHQAAATRSFSPVLSFLKYPL
ncbi:hypothetical protein IMY05_008G0010700 [Salix suchowensis]|nr:hypothetical protein IMY05_008G0010700 [Salix suchowensis]